MSLFATLADMPHLVLEYSDNVVDPIDARALFRELHEALMEFESFPIADIKSRAHRLRDFYVGAGGPQKSFAHLCMSLLSGRDISVRQGMVQACTKVLAKHFVQSYATGNCQLSVEMREMDRTCYGKHRPDPPT